MITIEYNRVFRMHLSDAEFEQYQTDGYVVVEDALSAETVETVRVQGEEFPGCV